MSRSSKRQLWLDLVRESAPLLDEHVSELMYHRAAVAWAMNETLSVADGLGGWADLTEIYEQYRILTVLKGE